MTSQVLNAGNVFNTNSFLRENEQSFPVVKYYWASSSAIDETPNENNYGCMTWYTVEATTSKTDRSIQLRFDANDRKAEEHRKLMEKLMSHWQVQE